MEILSFGRALIDLFFPRRCLNCDSVISHEVPLCVHCTSKLPFTHWKLDKENFAFQKLRALSKPEAAYSMLIFRHDNVTQKLMHHLKYENRPEIGQLLAEKAADKIDLSNYDGIIPIPIHPKKLKKRGYNQVIPFAKGLSEHFDIPLIEGFLIRVENNPSQVFKNREKRLSSIKNAFALTEKEIRGHYILIDDTLTTGATLSTCTNLIQAKPDIKISVITIACAI